METNFQECVANLLTPIIKDIVKESVKELLNESLFSHINELSQSVSAISTKVFARKPDIIPINKVAKILNVNKSTLWRWEKEGKLQKVKVGNKVYYTQEDINKIFGKVS